MSHINFELDEVINVSSDFDIAGYIIVPSAIIDSNLLEITNLYQDANYLTMAFDEEYILVFCNQKSPVTEIYDQAVILSIKCSI